MAKVQVNLSKCSEHLVQGDLIVVDWADKSCGRTVFLMMALCEKNKPAREMLVDISNGAILSGYTDLKNTTKKRLIESFYPSKVTIISRDEGKITVDII